MVWIVIRPSERYEVMTVVLDEYDSELPSLANSVVERPLDNQR
jgi:hypothetical protein